MIKQLAFAVSSLAFAASVHAADQYIFGLSGSNSNNHLTLNGTTRLGFADQGWYYQDGTHTPSIPNYIAGVCTSCALAGEYRNWFAFDISHVREPVSSVMLTLYSYSAALTSGNYYLNDFNGSVSSLEAGTGGVNAFNDLGTGVNYGFRFFHSATDSNTFFDYALNAGAVNSINAAIGRGDAQWAIGGSFSAGDVPVPPSSRVSEPETIALLGLGMVGLVASRRTLAKTKNA